MDLVVSMNTSAPGTALTTAILDAGTVSSSCTVGSTCSWTSVASGGSYFPTFEVGANQGVFSNLGPVQMTGTGGTLYPAQSLNFNNIGHQDGDPGAGSNATLTLSGTPGSATVVSGLVGLTLTMSASETNANDFDIFGFWQKPSGNYSMMQLNAQTGSTACTGIPSGTIGIRVEGKPTIHSPCIPLTAPGSYYASQTWNLTTGVTTLHVYKVDGTPVKCISGVGGGSGICNADGSSSVTMGATGGTFDHVTVGNNEIGYNNGTLTYFQNLMLNWTTAPSPMFWASGTSGSVQPPTSLKATVQ